MCKHVIYCFTKVIFTKHLLVWVSILFVCLFPPFWGEYVFGLYNFCFQKLCAFLEYTIFVIYIYTFFQISILLHKHLQIINVK